MKVIILVLSLNDNGGIYSKFYESQKNTWDSIQIEGVQTFYYFGNSAENIIENNNILTNCDEEGKCLKKTISTFNLLKDYDFDYLIRTNSSSYIDKKMIYEFLKIKPRKKYYAGIKGKYGNYEFASGACYVMSRDVFDTVMMNQQILDDTLIDDVSIGKLLDSLSIKPDDTDFKRFDFPRLDVNSKDFLNHFHYRLYTNKTDRGKDIEMMYTIFNKKNEYYNGE